MAEYLNSDNHPMEPYARDCDFTDFDIAICGDHAPHAVTCSYAGRDAEWEGRYDPDRKLPLAADARTPLVCAERLYRHIGPSRPLETTLPVRLLLAVPTDLSDAIGADAEIQDLQNSLASISLDLLETTILRGRFGITELRGALDAAQAKQRAQIEQSHAAVTRLTQKLRDIATNSTTTPPPAG